METLESIALTAMGEPVATATATMEGEIGAGVAEQDGEQKKAVTQKVPTGKF